ncbi:hypothetical protein BGW38_010685 [Lunasporangiospora selenospora]|uniref:Domain of unknown function at the cortex 1 domain-containing protein n=1 Tax=Lunasporangiospora selenospora TaxID=979761 RepID=A0A9P6KFD7_9FUNG|nr:hypothetical protein BGW38_010685 [Lunasporangiospora selenospora]
MAPSSIVEFNNIRYRIRISAGPVPNKTGKGQCSRPSSDTDFISQYLTPIAANNDSDPLLIETEDFVGHIVFRIKGQDQISGYEDGQKQDGLPILKDSAWFDQIPVFGYGGAGLEGQGTSRFGFGGGKRQNTHLSSLQIVGRFKREWPADQIVIGGTFEKPLKLPPFVSTAIKFLQSLDPGLNIDLTGPRPGYSSSLLSCINTINVSEANPCPFSDLDGPTPPHDSAKEAKDENEDDKKHWRSSSETLTNNMTTIPPWPSPNGEHIIENTDLLIDTAEDPKKRAKLVRDANLRRAYFSKSKHLARHQFRTDLVYSFDLFNPFVDCARFALKLPGFSLDFFKYLNDQPLTYEIKSRDGSVVFAAMSMELVPVNGPTE